MARDSCWLKGKISRAPGRNPKIHDHIPGYPTGSKFRDRHECSAAGVHAPLRAGIHGNKDDGAFSVVLSHGYKDDKDNGETCIYSGEGGRNTQGDKMDQMMGIEKWEGERNADQEWRRGNKALKISCKTGKAVRLVRGANRKGGTSRYAPASGYRYDGLYRVEQASMEPGEDGFLTCKFFLRRLPGQPPLPGNKPKTQKTRLEDERPVAGSSKLPAPGRSSREIIMVPPQSSRTVAVVPTEAGPSRSFQANPPPPSRLPTSPELPPIATLQVRSSSSSPEPSLLPTLPTLKKPNNSRTSLPVTAVPKISSRLPSGSAPIGLRYPLPPQPLMLLPKTPVATQLPMRPQSERPLRPAEVAPLRMVSMVQNTPLPRASIQDATMKKRSWETDVQGDSESEEEGEILDGERYSGESEDGEILSNVSGSPVEKKEDRWAVVAGKKRYQDLKFKKKKLLV